MKPLSAEYWNNRYLTQEIGWNLGAVSPPIQQFIDNLPAKDLAILIPGAGNAYEAEYLHKQGFTEVHIIDLSQQAMLNFMHRVPTFPFQHLHQYNFFDHQGRYNIIIEQTFFCALNPELREEYKLKMYDLLKPGGQLIGLLFNIPLHTDRPPFGGSKEEYISLFSSHFNIIEMDICPTSIKPRAGNELFFRMKKKQAS